MSNSRNLLSLLRAPLGAALLSAPLLAQALPPVPVPTGNPITPAKTILGKLLFWEEQMSSDNRVACGTCHRATQGGGDPRVATNPGPDGVSPSADDTVGSPGVVRSDANNHFLPSTTFGLAQQVTGRASPSNVNAAWFPNLFWDGRATGVFLNPETGAVSLSAGGALESQSIGPVLNGVEMAHESRNWSELKVKLANVKPMALATNLPPDMAAAIAGNVTYPALFQAAFGTPDITAERIAFALATYQRTLVADQTPYDQAQRGVPGALTQSQTNGMNTFLRPPGAPGGGFGCGGCHVPPLFAGITAPPGGGAPVPFRNLGLRPIAQDSGRQAISGNLADRGKFKVPSLRNAGLRTQYMHTGQFQNLNQVLGFYIGGGGPNLDNKDPLLVPLNPPPPAPPIPQQTINEVIDFVSNALTDPRVRLGQFPFDRPTLASERIPPTGFQFGIGTAGTGGRVPTNLAGIPANLGNPDFKLGLANGRGGAAATLAVALQRAIPGTQIGGININVDLLNPPLLFPMLLDGAAGVAGVGYTTFAFGIPNDPGLTGLQVSTQWFVWDSGVVAGAASTAGADVRFF